MPLIHTYIDLSNNQEWALVNMESNLQQMFDKIKNQYWQKWLSNIKYTVKWDKEGIISDDSAFKIFERHNQILISLSAMVRPRIQLISLLLHTLIHIYLSVCSKDAIKINHHDSNFRKIMLFLNKTFGSQISVCSHHLTLIISILNYLLTCRRSTSFTTHRMKKNTQCNGTSAPESVRTMNRSMAQFVVHRFPTSLTISGMVMRIHAVVNSSVFLR